MVSVYILLTILFISSVPGGYGSKWNHIDQDEWPDICLKGRRQSPINLDANSARDKSFEKFDFVNYNKNLKGTAFNNGHSVVLILEESDDRPRVRGGGLSKEYITDHIHFHWQAEHTVNGHRYPLEAHLVHYAAEYKNFFNAFNYRDGIAVLGVLYDMSPDDDIELEALTDVLDEVENTHKKFPISREIQLRSYLPRDVAGFYRYDGSLTTPNCSEIVTWTVFTNTLPISKNQIKRFEDIRSESGKLTENFRALQKLGDRTVYLKRSPMFHSEHNRSSHTNYNILIMFTIVSLRFAFN
ncbi:hypothetical protein RI129_001485 [Pyrocoelia pectoralis]|uniref:Alpha-carbonic anhydrase domain-containing protein n=1 Tax=Pyrocoelia pectoralis TaxID=417401 RepID=A0AAN7VTW6_9COLE